jgi:6-phosphogluconolactonase (cycloisomerase 2 family)
MKAKFALAASLLLVCTLISCGGSSTHYPTTPKFLIAIDGSGPGTNVNVFPVDATTGALGTAVTGSPFDMNLTDPMMVEVHPNGHFAYVPDGNDGSIHAWNVNESTGVPTEVGTAVVNESGSFFEPCCGAGDAATHVITVTPKGKFLYSANNDATVGAYSIGSNGALTHIADLNISACASGDPDQTGAITSTDKFVWVTDTCANEDEWHVITLKIGSNGSLTQTNSVALAGVYSWLWSIQVNPAANFVYVGDEGGDAQIYSFSYDSTGALTQLGPQVVENNSSDCRNIAHSPDGKFFYTTDDDDVAHAFSVNTSNGAISELSASPYPGGPGQIVVDLTGKFVYLGDSDNTGQVVGYSRDATSGALTSIGNTDTDNGEAHAIGIIR